MSYKDKTEKFITDLISQGKISNVPVNVEEVAQSLPIDIREYGFNEDVSAVLIVEDDGTATIGYNPKETLNRRRFSIAHEIGHYILHSNKSKGIFMDKLMFRKNITLYSKKEEIIEKEANYFAANLLMPKELVTLEVQKLDPFNNDEDNIKELARIFEVSSIAMTYRLINLGLYSALSF
ncbi:ImmA/IrrE family metallo-endopeptidase [Sphingobacterium siyangense]|uniref:ImmA/IrrE family metallo-endopeptidase n=1 Tax=Sphingobacterium siyangense TaxID=459529 RepID=UPI003DA26C7D